MMSILEVLQTALQKDCRLEPGIKILVGFSGGADSLCLLHGLSRLGWPLVAAHFDHAMRPESALDAQKAAGLAAALGVECQTGRGDVPAYARENSLSMEEAARTLRYHFLFDRARRCGAGVVAVAHTADDQVETVLMHLLRGAGLSGLKGMTSRAVLPGWDGAIPLVRPLLGTWRADIEGYCRENNLESIEDPSNRSLEYFRNRLRHELIPYLQGYNPNIRAVLWRMADALAGDHELLEGQVESIWGDCVQDQGTGYVALDAAYLRTQAEGMQRSILRRAIALLRPALRDVGFDALCRAQEFLRQPSRSGEMDLLDGLSLRLEQDRMYLLEPKACLPYPWPRVSADVVSELQVPGGLALPDGRRLQAEMGNVESALKDQEWQAALDLDTLEMPLSVRAARAGERWQPLGMQNGTIKFSDFWINAGLPRRARAGWPVVFSGGQAAWVPGFRPAHFCRVTEKTQQVILLRLISDESVA